MTDVARLGIIVDATGARREIKLTTEELVKLANTGKQVEPAVRQIGPAIRTATMPAAQATFEFGKLRQGMTSLAIAAGALPGPIGRVASTLAPLALGGGITVGVLAGITAITFAWKKFHEEGDKALEMMTKLRANESSMALGAMRSRMATLEFQEKDLSDLVTGARAGRTPAERDPSSVAGNRRRDELQRIRDRMNELSIAIRRGETEHTRIVAEESAKRAKIAEEEFMSRMRAAQGIPLPFSGPAQPITAMVEGREAYQTAISAAKSPIQGGATEPDAQSMFELRRHVEESSRALTQMADAARLNAERIKEHSRQVEFAIVSIAQAGLGAIASRNRGNFGGVLAGTAMGAVTGWQMGGPWGAAAGAAISFVGGILGMNSNNREEQRRNAEAMQRERQLREELNKQLQGAIRNGPAGFMVGSFLPAVPHANPPGAGGVTPVGPGGPRKSVAAGGTSVVMQNVTISINGNRSGADMVREFMKALRTRAAATVGNGGSLSDALELMA